MSPFKKTMLVGKKDRKAVKEIERKTGRQKRDFETIRRKKK